MIKNFHGIPFDLVEQKYNEPYVHLMSKFELNNKVQIVPCHNYLIVFLTWCIDSNCKIVTEIQTNAMFERLGFMVFLFTLWNK